MIVIYIIYVIYTSMPDRLVSLRISILTYFFCTHFFSFHILSTIAIKRTILNLTFDQLLGKKKQIIYLTRGYQIVRKRYCNIDFKRISRRTNIELVDLANFMQLVKNQDECNRFGIERKFLKSFCLHLICILGQICFNKSKEIFQRAI